jgi:hypothetical protein
MRLFGIAIVLAVIPVSARAEMSVGDFVVRADALKSKGVLAMMSSDVKLLGKEMDAVTTAYRAELKAARAAGKRPHSCPPAKGSLKSQELITHFRSLPASTGVRSGFYSLMKKKYPCPA